MKLYLTNALQTEVLCQYVFNLARYDQNYDIRDRARFLKQFVFPTSGKPTILTKNARRIFLAAKPAPLLESKYQGREQFQLGSLSHYLNIRATGYHDLPMFPELAPDSSVRNVEVIVANEAISEEVENIGASSSHRSHEKVKSSSKPSKKSKSFYSDTEKSSSEYSSDDDDDDGDDDEESGSEESDNENSSTKNESSESDSSDSEEDSSSSEEEDSSASASEDEKNERAKAEVLTQVNERKGSPAETIKSTASGGDRANLDLLLDLDDIVPTGPIMTPSLGGFLSPLSAAGIAPGTVPSNNKFELVGPTFIPSPLELVSKINGHGLQINYRFTRGPHLYSAKMVSIELTFRNESQKDLANIRISKKSLPTGLELNEFAAIAKLGAGQTAQSILGIDYNDSTQVANFEIESSGGASKIALKSPLGELIRSVAIPEATFKEEQTKLRGMNEHSARIETSANKLPAVRTKIFEVANVAAVNRSDANDDQLILFAGQTMASKSLVLITVERPADNGNVVVVTVNCEKMVVGSMLLNELKTALKN